MLDVVIHASRYIDWQGRYARFVFQGLERHGLKPRIAWNTTAQQCDVAVIMGPNHYEHVERSGIPYIMLNRKFVGNRPETVHDTVAISWDGFNGRGTFCVDEVDPKRLERYINPETEIEPWRDNATPYLLCQQSNIGRAEDIRDMDQFYRWARASSPQQILWRPKPLGEHAIKPEAVRQQLIQAGAIVHLNSTISIEALMAGVPVFSFDYGDPSWPITCHDFQTPVKEFIAREDRRLELFQYMAHCQWSEQEIASGEFWAQIYPKRGPKLYEWSGNGV